MWPLTSAVKSTTVNVDYYANSYLKVELREYELCKTCRDQICCSTFEIPLTLNEALALKYDPVKWQKGLAVIQRDEKGTCIYHTARGCSIYNKRPAACMEYICKNDSRIAAARGEYVPNGLKNIIFHKLTKSLNFCRHIGKRLKNFAFLLA